MAAEVLGLPVQALVMVAVEVVLALLELMV
jgi:hypothetical protein